MRERLTSEEFAAAEPSSDRDGWSRRAEPSPADLGDPVGTERALRELRGELARVARVTALGKLTASLAHELRQPLTAILSNAQAARRLLAADPPDLDEARAALAGIVADEERAAAVIERLSGLLRSGARKRSRLDLNAVVREVLTLLHGEARRLEVAVQLDLAAVLPPVLGDRVELQQVVMNLVLNAFEAMARVEGRPRRLRVESRRAAPAAVAVAVSDTGVGLDAATRERLFEPFFTTKPEGLGMGLAICRALVADHGGRLWATANPDRGATFHLHLPAARRGEG